MKNIGAQIEVFVEPRVREKEMVCLLLALAWHRYRYWDTKEDSPTLIVVVAILTDWNDTCEVLLLLTIMV